MLPRTPGSHSLRGARLGLWAATVFLAVAQISPGLSPDASAVAQAAVRESTLDPDHAAAPSGDPIRIEVDLTRAPLRRYHARLSIPVAPGPLVLRHPKWIPGEHSPSGPVGDLAGLSLRANDQPIEWQRDPLDPWSFRITIPPGARHLEIELDHLVPSAEGEFTAGPSASARLAILAWNTVLLYPSDARPDSTAVEASLRLPPDWQAATALRPESDRGALIRYARVSLETLVDSPVAAGRHMLAIPLDAPMGAPEHVLHLVADAPEALLPEAKVLEPLKRHLVPETLALFGQAPHYPRYDFLFALSDHVAHFGLEHHASSDNRLPERTLLEPSRWLVGSGLLPHEFVHSWNAKYRRPEGLATGDYHTPMVGDLLWVYEGLTSYLGEVLTARTGLVSDAQARESLALEAATLAQTQGRAWRPLLDTARDAQHAYLARFEGASWRRGVDFYDEGVMLWLEVDATIREQTKGARSLDDFCAAFFGPPASGARVVPFTRAELVAALDAIAPRDWERFFLERVDGLRPKPPTEGLEAAGWKLAYDEKPNTIAEAHASREDGGTDLRHSLGAYVARGGKLVDVLPSSPLAASGIGVGARFVAVNARAYTPKRLDEALEAARRTGEPIDLIVRNADYYSTHRVEYTGGPRHPHLVRDASREDWLSRILAPRTWERDQLQPESDSIQSSSKATPAESTR